MQNELVNANRRLFFGKNKENEKSLKDEEMEEKEADKKEAKKEEKETKEKVKEETQAEETASDEKKADKKDEKKSSSSSSSESEEVELSQEDIKKIKELIADQDKTIEGHELKIEEMEKQIKKLKEKLVYQIAENDNTVKRYRKQMDDTKQFAISKFAKELLDVRDSLELALEHCNVEKIKDVEEIDTIKEMYANICKGQEMTSEVMDKILSKFEVVQFEPLGEKFDPNVHEAVFMVPESEYENDHVGAIMQSGWRIGERVLRAPKVGIVKKAE